MAKGRHAKTEATTSEASDSSHHDPEGQHHSGEDPVDDPQAAPEKFERWSSHFAAHVEVDVMGQKIVLRQDPSEEMLEETGSTVWDIGRVIAAFIHRDRDLSKKVRGKRIIELGSGCGLLGIVLTMMGAHVTITDVPAVRYLLEENVRMNITQEVLRKSKGSICVEDHVWGHPCENLRPPYDMVVGTDVVYREDIIAPLVASVVNLSNHNTTVIIANEIRSRRILDLYFQKITEMFKYQRLSLSSVDDLFETEVYEAFYFRLKKAASEETQNP